MALDLDKFRKIQNGYNVSSKRKHDLIMANIEMKNHFEDTYDTETVIIDGEERKLMIIHDTDTNTHERKIKSPNDKPFNLGQYVIWNNQYWIISVLDIDDKTWCRGYMYLCQYKISWQNAYGDIVQRYVYFEDFTKYSNGAYFGNTITVTDNQYGIIVPVDDETINIKRELRVAIDFQNVDIPDIYSIVNRKTVLNDYTLYNRGGTFTIVLTIGRFDHTKDKKITLQNGDTVWICDYFEKNNVNENYVSYSLNCSNDLKIGKSKTFKAIATNQDGSSNILSNCTWSISSNGDINYKLFDNAIILKTNDESLINNIIKLNLIINGSIINSFDIKVVSIL